MQRLLNFYQKSVYHSPKRVLFLMLILIMAVAVNARHFELDASAESLVLENDSDMINYRMISERFGSSEFLVVTYTPKWPLFSEPSLQLLKQLRDDIEKLDHIESVNSLLDVPLLENPPVPVAELLDNIKNLENPAVDIELAKKELAGSPLYKEMLLNLESNTTAIQINRPFDARHRSLTKAREDLWRERDAHGLTSAQEAALDELNQSIKDHNAHAAAELHKDIQNLRDVLKRYQDKAEIHLGGVPMIADDMITYVENDMYTFGMGVFVFLVATLSLIFRRARWVIVALACCALTVVFMTGVLGLFKWRVTVISSNFVSLLLIITMSLCIHLIVRYREVYAQYAHASQLELVRNTVLSMFKPCLYMALTTIVAFNSLIFSGIRPVIDFGWMMATGVAVALAIVFVLFPVFVLIIGRRDEAANIGQHSPVTDFLAFITLKHGKKVLWANAILFVLMVLGIAQLKVENSFINYFHESTEIHQGMKVVDESLGGTTPLDVIINFPALNTAPADEEMDDFFNDGQAAEDPAKYWFTLDKIAQIHKVHAYLDSRPEIGKVISLDTMVQIAEEINGQPLDAFQLGLLYAAIPDEFRSIVLTPYVSPEHGQARISVRILDSLPDLKRNELLKSIHQDMEQKLGFKPDEYMVGGMMVLYNNMLQSLFKSQILTLGAVFLGIMLMFMLLFRSWKIALIAIVPNLMAAGVVLGLMGWAAMPLDMMTITIAAITIGIAVDDTIHYIHRFKEEFKVDGDYVAAVERCHASIGKAVYYTSLTIIVGFSILALSNFIPTIYFGLLTGLAMLIALLQVLTLLPKLLIVFKPLGR